MKPKMIVLLAVVFALVLESWLYEPRKLDYGVTFSQKFAEELGLDPANDGAGWRKLYIDILDDLKVRDLRLVAYWDKIEPEEGKFNFEDLDWQVAEAERRGAKVVLTVGSKVPRWPECHEPKWLGAISARDQNVKIKSQNAERERNLSPSPLPLRRGGGEGAGFLLRYVEEIIKRYHANSAVIAWQVENEPLFPFGECGTIPISLLNQEIKLVKSLSDKPIILTDSGELGFAWPYLTIKSDVFGTTLYRYVSNERLGDINYWFIPSAYFRLKAAWARLWGREYLISELQAEPWSTESLTKTPLEKQYKTMNPEIFKEVINYAERSGFSKAYLWGAEWWYWMKEKQGKPEMWDNAKALFNANQQI